MLDASTVPGSRAQLRVTYTRILARIINVLVPSGGENETLAGGTDRVGENGPRHLQAALSLDCIQWP